MEERTLQAIKPRSKKKKMQLTIEPSMGERFTVFCRSADDVRMLKETIEWSSGHPASTQTLVFKGKVLDDATFLMAYEIASESKIQLILPEFQEPLPSAWPSLLPPPPVSFPSPPLTLSLPPPLTLPPPPVRPFRIQLRLPPLPPGHRPQPQPQPFYETRGEAEDLIVRLLPFQETKHIDVEVNTSEKVSELRNHLVDMSRNPQVQLPEQYFFIHQQQAMYEDQSFGWHGVKQNDIIEVFRGYATSSE